MYNPLTTSFNLSNVIIPNAYTLNYLRSDFWAVDLGQSCSTYINMGGGLSGNWNVVERFYNYKDALKIIKIRDSQFKTINFSFPDTTIVPVVSTYYDSIQNSNYTILMPFLGTNSIAVTGNSLLTDISLSSYMFRGIGYFFKAIPYNTTYYTPSITFANNPLLTSVNCYITYNLDTNWTNYSSSANTLSFNISDPIKLFNVTFNIPTSSSKVPNPFSRSSNLSLTFTFNQNSSALITFNLTLTSDKLTNLKISNLNINSNTSITQFSANQTVGDYYYFNTSNQPLSTTFIDFTNIKESTILTNLSGSTTSSFSFIKALSTTQINVLTANIDSNGGLHPSSWKFTNNPIPAEIIFKALSARNITMVPQYDFIPTKPNTLLMEQYKTVTGPLSGRRQPYSFYIPLSDGTLNSHLGALNPGFGMNKNSIYTWPLSVLNNHNGFAVDDYSTNVIHPRFAITAAHLDPGSAGTPLPRAVYFRDFNNSSTIYSTNIISKTIIASTDIALYELSPALPVSAFPGFYILPNSLICANSATKIPPWIHGFDISQDRDITPSAYSTSFWTPDPSWIYPNTAFSSDEGTTLSYKYIRIGDSGHPNICFINKKPVLLMTWSTTGGGPSISYYSDAIQTAIDAISGVHVPLNLITQADLDVYANLYD